MKKFNKSMSAIFAFFSLIILSCRPAMFKSITVKTEPELKLNLGSTEFKFEKFLSDNAITKIEGMDLFRYKIDEADTDMKFRFHHSVSDLNLDMGNNEELKLGDFQTGMGKTINQTFTIPKITGNQTYTIDVGKEIKDRLSFPSQNTNIATTGSEHVVTPASLGINFSNIQTITFEDGATFDITINTYSNDFTVKVTEMKLLKADNSEIKSWTGEDAAPKMPIGGEELPAAMKLELSLKVSGGNPGKTREISINTGVTGDVQKATGVTLDPIAENIGHNIPFETKFGSGEFNKGIIKIGNINFAKPALPAGSNGITMNFTVKAKQNSAEGLDIDINEGDNNLQNKTINNNPLKLEGRITVTVQNATYIKPDKALEAKFDFNITEFKEIELKMGDDFNPNHNYKHNIDSLKDWVNLIRFKFIKINLKITNGLPAENDIKVTIGSPEFEIPDTLKTFIPSSAEQTETVEKENFDFKPQEHDNINVNTTIKFGDSSTDGKIIKIKNVQTEKEYSLKGNIEIDKDWEYAKVNPRGNTFTGQFPKTGEKPTDLSAIRDILKGTIKIEDANIYIYLNSKVLKKGNANLTGRIYADYTHNENTKTVDIIGTESKSEEFKFTDKLPETFYKYKKGDKKEPYIGKFPEESAKGPISEPLSDAPKDLKLKYKLKLNEVTIHNNPEFQSMKPEDKKLNIDLMMELPIKLNVPNEAEVKSIETDSLSSTSKAEGDPINEVMSMARSVSMTADYENKTGLKLKTKIIFKNKKDEILVEKIMEITEEKGSISFELEAADMNKLKDQKDLLTEFKVILPAGKYKLKQDASLKIKASISSKLKVNKTFKVF